MKNELRKTFNKHDVIDIFESDEINIDEYDPEIEEVLKLKYQKLTPAEFRTKIHKIFIKLFGKNIAGPKTRYKELAEEILVLFHKEKLKKRLTECENNLKIKKYTRKDLRF